MTKEVVIVGAGPAGLILARDLARRGVYATVYDGKNRVSDGAAKASGIFSKKGLDTIGIDFSGAKVNELSGAIVHGGGESIAIDADVTKAYVLDRGRFAETLAKEAVSEGAKLELARRIDKERLMDLASDKDIILVGADGAVSTVANAFGFPPVKEYILTYKAEYDHADIDRSDRVRLFFNNRIAKRFFGWTVPYSKSKIEIGIGISSLSNKNSAAAFNDFIRMKEIDGAIGNAVRTVGYASIIPLTTRKRTVSGNVLLVGDAAGQVKATTGGGVIFGSACAMVAARCIAKHVFEGKPIAEYEHEWRRQYNLDLELHRMVHRYYSSLGNRSLAVLIRWAKLAHADRFLGRYGDMDSPYLMFKRLFLRNLIQ
jgi:flavin-dependent dehydrogenase